MGIIGTIVIGFLVGLVARFLTPGNDKLGFIMTTVLGIVGSVVGTYIGSSLGWYEIGEPAGFLGSVLGAMAVLLFARLLTRG
ncbi:MAG: GlsB/YeaQ/YmgE family stress response membrane protein [Bdellovibrio sp.]